MMFGLAVASMTFYGRTVDQTPSRRPVGNVTLAFCRAVPVRHPRNAITCAGRRLRLTTDGGGRFTIRNVPLGSYIVAGRAKDVAWFMSPFELRRSAAAKPSLLFVCSHAAQPRDCAPPSMSRGQSLL